MFRRTQFALIYNMQTIVITDMVLDQHLTHEEARNAHIFNQVLGQAIDMAMGQKKKTCDRNPPLSRCQIKVGLARPEGF